MSPVVAAEHGQAAPPTCCFSCWPARLAHLTCRREDLGIHSVHGVCPFWLGKAIWILFKRLFILEKEDEASRACWWKVGLGDAADDRPSQCPERSAAASEACVKSPLQTWVLKLLLLGSWVHQSPHKCWHYSVVGRYLTGSACLGSQANVQWSWKENQGPHAPSSSQHGHKCVCWNTRRETSTFLIPGKSKSAFWPAPLTVDLVQLNILHISWDRAERNLVDSLM